MSDSERHTASNWKTSGTRRVADAEGVPLIVFAEDSAVQSLKLMELLEEAGYRALSASEGKGALELAQQHIPDLILLDLEMPGLNGVETCREMKKNPFTAHIPVLILTGHDDPVHLVAAFEAGCAGYLIKGSTDTSVLTKIARHLPRPSHQQDRSLLG